MSTQIFFMGKDGCNVKCVSSKTGKVVDSFFGDCDSVDPKLLPIQVAGHQESDFIFEIESYLNRHKDQAITMKRIQSRFKQRKITCLEYSNMLSKRGYWIDTKGPASQWAVTVRTLSYE